MKYQTLIPINIERYARSKHHRQDKFPRGGVYKRLVLMEGKRILKESNELLKQQ